MMLSLGSSIVKGLAVKAATEVGSRGLGYAAKHGVRRLQNHLGRHYN